ncbi:hypothetical protein GCM10007301_45170 [Azorhizobium oxalatiphilum]|uniref:Uncharacterized protein n=1 Tax=Azorhizobium oxalatiphilum TaxID=980631 RepID=A0A917CC82_9HYPH|nr:hypothetical protein GCM10007301_45170 [Azorhizobium oxalatiphilum]
MALIFPLKSIHPFPATAGRLPVVQLIAPRAADRKRAGGRSPGSLSQVIVPGPSPSGGWGKIASCA